MKNSLLTGLLLVSFNLIAQDKKAYYYDENLISVSKEAFWQDEQDLKKLHLNYDVDTAVIFIKVAREYHGMLDKATLELIKTDLESSTNTYINDNNLIVIDYWPGKDECNSTGAYDRKQLIRNQKEYFKNLHALAPVSQFYIYSQKEGLEKYQGIYLWKLDVNDRIKNTFFQLHYPCASVVAIHPDGNYIAYYGEYSKQQVWGFVKELIK